MGGIVMKGCLGMEMDVMSESREIDIFELARLRREVSGDVTLEAMPELAKALEGEAKVCECTWQASGLGEVKGRPAAELTLRAHLVTQCVRCGKPCDIDIEKTVPFVFTKTEAEADAMPIEEDDGYDVVVGSRRFDTTAWVEEELILSLPAFPQHEDCEPDRTQLETAETEETLEKPNPFAVLAGLKTK